MKVLWITNILFPDICEYLGKKKPVVGGWMHSSLSAIREIDDSIHFAVASIYKGKTLLEKNINGVTYYCIPYKSEHPPIEYESALENYWIEIKKRFQPDIVHIHGSEFQHGLAYIRACGNENVVLSIQGCVSAIRRYALGGIEYEEWKKNHSFHDIVKFINPQNKFSAISTKEVREKYNILRFSTTLLDAPIGIEFTLWLSIQNYIIFSAMKHCVLLFMVQNGRETIVLNIVFS